MGKRIVFVLENGLFLVIHLMIAGRFRWAEAGAKIPGKVGLAALDVIEALHPAAVVAGHRPADASNDPRYIDETRRYLRAFSAAAKRTTTALDLYEAVLAEYPDRLNRGVLWNSARAMNA